MTMLGNRPVTIQEVAQRCKSGAQSFDTAILEFLDFFYTNTNLRAASIEGRPEKIDAVRDAYLAAVAEHLARSYGLTIPDWTEEQGNELHYPFFSGGLESLKGVLVAESPTSFRRRMLFVSKDALSRPRLDQNTP